MDEDIIAEIELHQETISVDSNSPLHLIREKELEISGRVLAAKRQSDEIVTSARKKAAEVVGTAESEGGAGAADRESEIRAQALKEADRLRQSARADAEAIGSQVEARRDEAARLVLDAVAAI